MTDNKAMARGAGLMAASYPWRLGGYKPAAVKQAKEDVRLQHIEQTKALHAELASRTAETYRLTDALAKLGVAMRTAETTLAEELQALPYIQGPDLQHLQASLEGRSMQRQQLEARVRRREERLAVLRQIEADYAAELGSVARRLQARPRLDLTSAEAPQ